MIPTAAPVRHTHAAELGFPVAVARLKIRGGFWRWLVQQCPIPNCVFKSHVHGGGNVGGDPRLYLSHRAHLSGGRGYVLIDGDPAHTLALIAKHRAASSGGVSGSGRSSRMAAGAGGGGLDA